MNQELYMRVLELLSAGEVPYELIGKELLKHQPDSFLRLYDSVTKVDSSAKEGTKNSPLPIWQEIRDKILGGNVLGAIELLQEHTDLSSLDAMRVVERARFYFGFAPKDVVLMSARHQAFVELIAPTDHFMRIPGRGAEVSEPNKEVDPGFAEIRQNIIGYNKIKAIQKLRSITGLGLHEAKRVVQRASYQLGFPGHEDLHDLVHKSHQEYVDKIINPYISSKNVPPTPVDSTIKWERDFVKFYQEKNVVGAIKTIRANATEIDQFGNIYGMGLGLFESKRIYDRVVDLVNDPLCSMANWLPKSSHEDLARSLASFVRQSK